MNIVLESNDKGYRILENLYSDTREWLKFSESKNAALLTLNAASLFGILRLLEGGDLDCFIKITIILLLISLSVNLWSFIPRRVRSKGSITPNYRLVNMMYYKDISRLKLRVVQEFMEKKYFEGNVYKYTDEYFNDLTKQIYSLSIITRIKNTYFKIALVITMLAFIVMIVSIIL